MSPMTNICTRKTPLKRVSLSMGRRTITPRHSIQASATRMIGSFVMKAIRNLELKNGCSLRDIKRFLNNQFKNSGAQMLLPSIRLFLHKSQNEGLLVKDGKGKYRLAGRKRVKKGSLSMGKVKQRGFKVQAAKRKGKRNLKVSSSGKKKNRGLKASTAGKKRNLKVSSKSSKKSGRGKGKKPPRSIKKSSGGKKPPRSIKKSSGGKKPPRSMKKSSGGIKPPRSIKKSSGGKKRRSKKASELST